jgi:malate synthase
VCCSVTTGLHIEIQIDRDHAVGATDAAGVKDVCLESALTTIQDCEDSVAAVDAEDKVVVYRNWLGLMKGNLTDTFKKGSDTLTRRLNPDRSFTTPDGGTLTLPGRSLLFVRNVGHLMTNPAILSAQGGEIPEGFMDGLFTAFCSLHDLQGNGELKNSRAGLHVYREAEDAWPGRSESNRRALLKNRGPVRFSSQYPQGRHHGRGTSHYREPRRVHPPRE